MLEIDGHCCLEVGPLVQSWAHLRRRDLLRLCQRHAVSVKKGLGSRAFALTCVLFQLLRLSDFIQQSRLHDLFRVEIVCFATLQGVNDALDFGLWLESEHSRELLPMVSWPL